MLLFFGDSTAKVYAVETSLSLTSENKYKLQWLFDLPQIKMSKIAGNFVGPRANMITPWSTNAVEITKNMGKYTDHHHHHHRHHHHHHHDHRAPNGLTGHFV